MFEFCVCVYIYISAIMWQGAQLSVVTQAFILPYFQKKPSPEIDRFLGIALTNNFKYFTG